MIFFAKLVYSSGKIRRFVFQSHNRVIIELNDMFLHSSI